MDNPRATKLTRYHLVSRQRTGHTAPFSASRKFVSDLASSLLHNDHPPLRGQLGCENRDDSKRCHGRTRMALPIEPPAPRPCSAAACRTRSHLAGLSDRCCAAYSPLQRIYSLYGVLYPENCPFVNSLSALFLDGNLLRRYNKQVRRRFFEK